jgi:hypothetical protein
MDDKTRIIRPPQKPEGKKPEPAPAKKPVVAIATETSPKKQPFKPVTKPPTPQPPGGKLTGGVIALASMALVLIGVSTSLLTVYLLGDEKTGDVTQEASISQAELDNVIAPVPDENTEDSDKALIESVVGTGVIRLLCARSREKPVSCWL